MMIQVISVVGAVMVLAAYAIDPERWMVRNSIPAISLLTHWAPPY